jgi:hypothetical protein
MKAATLRSLALALPDTTEAPHFDRAAFRTPRRIFATLASDGATVNVRLDPSLQQALVESNPAAFRPVDNAWGKQGWTECTLGATTAAEMKAVLSEAHALSCEPPPRRPRARLIDAGGTRASASAAHSKDPSRPSGRRR